MHMAAVYAADHLVVVQAAARAARWQAYKNLLHPGVHKKDVYWSEIENGPVVPSPDPVTCPGGYRMVRYSRLDE